MKMNLNALENREFWENAGVKLPEFSIETMRANTRENPVWVHFGAGNISGPLSPDCSSGC